MAAKTIDVRDEIVWRLKEDERSLMWLQRQTKISYGTLYSCLIKKHFSLSEENAKKINNVFNQK